MKRVLKVAAVAALFAAPLQAAPYADPYTSMLAIGDSLSDEGNVLDQATWFGATLGAPYLDVDGTSLATSAPRGGTFTNGLPWTDVLGQAFRFDGKTYLNLAAGGATAGPSSGVVDMQLQFNALLGVAADPSFNIGLRPLTTMWFGANDIFGAIQEEMTTGNSFASQSDIDALNGFAEQIADTVMNVVATLVQYSPTSPYRDFLVLNLPDLGQIPRFLSAGPLQAIATGATDAFNNKLAANKLVVDGVLTGLGITDANINILDVNSLFSDLRSGSIDLGYTDLTTPCVVNSPATTGPLPQVRSFTCADPTLNLFIDAVHPEAKAHEAIGRAAAAMVGVTPVPLPAGAWLLLGGLGLLALRRKRAA